MSAKIVITMEDVNSGQVEQELRRQEISSRMAEHQKKVFSSSPAPRQSVSQNMMVLAGIGGLITSVCAWRLGEYFGYEQNPILWGIAIGGVISFGLSILEGVSEKNGRKIIINGFYGVVLGIIGGGLFYYFANRLYGYLGGGHSGFSIQQVVARGIAWSVLGGLLTIAPGVVLRSSKKFLLSFAGGAIGGFFGGVLFDVVASVSGSVEAARFVNILALGCGAAIATVFLEEAAKRGWLKVVKGIIAGKQFIIYRNPTFIGSSPKCEIYLFKDPKVQSKHASINIRNGTFFISSIDSAPVYVNQQIVREKKLVNGDVICIGDTVFRFDSKTIQENQ